jgi:hypothetical protein
MGVIGRAIFTVYAVAVVILTSWWTVLAFIGGTAPVLGWELEGGLGPGLVWLFVVDPVLLTVAYWIGLVIVLPFSAADAALSTRSKRREKFGDVDS